MGARIIPLPLKGARKGFDPSGRREDSDKLAAKIRGYWARAGRDVKVWSEASEEGGKHMWTIRSNIIMREP